MCGLLVFFLWGAPLAVAAPVFAPVTGSPFVTGSAPLSVAFSPGGRLLATANLTNSTVSMSAVGPGGALTPIAGSPFGTGTGPVAVAFSPGGDLLATANQNTNTVSVFTVASGGALTTVAGSPFGTGNGPLSVAFSPGEDLLATANLSASTVSVFEVGAGGALTPVAGSPFAAGSGVASVAFSPGGDLLATANFNAGTVSVFEVGAGGALTQVAGSPFVSGTSPISVAFSPGGGLLATANRDANSVSVFAVGPGGTLAPVAGSPFGTGNGPFSVAFSPGGGLLASANLSASTVSVFAVGSGGALTPVEGSPFATGNDTRSVAFSPSGGLSATANAGANTVSVFAVGAPSAAIDAPAAGRVYGLGQVIPTNFTCADAPFAPGIASCTDANASVSPGMLDTATAGTHSYAVTATSLDGQTATTSVTYSVAGPPTVSIGSPHPGQAYTVGQPATASFVCADGLGGPGIKSCVDAGGASSPATIDTGLSGSRTFTVTATSLDGQTTTTSVPYTVTPSTPPVTPRLPPTAAISVSPATAGLTYRLSGAGSSAPAGHHITSYRWTIAGRQVATTKMFTYTFATARHAYPVLLTVTDDQQQSASTTATVTPRAKRVRVSLVVQFARNQAALTAATRQALNPLRPLVRSATAITLTGYCAANEPSRHHLLVKLSRLRAQTVRTYLFSGDSHPRRNVTIIAKGATGFIATNKTPAGRARNRRATITITYLKPIS
jgi:6-phosphogluconolactonase